MHLFDIIRKNKQCAIFKAFIALEKCKNHTKKDVETIGFQRLSFAIFVRFAQVCVIVGYAF